MKYTLKSTLLLAMLVVVSFFAPGCEKDDPPLPPELQSLIVSAYPNIVAYAASSKITCLVNLAATIKITKDGVVLFEESGKTVAFTTPHLKETTTFQITVGSGSSAKIQDIIIPVTPPSDPRLKVLFDGEWQYTGSLIKIPGAVEYIPQYFPSHLYDNVRIFRANGTCSINYGTDHALNEPPTEGVYKYFVTNNEITLEYGATWTILVIDEKELKLHTMAPHASVENLNGFADYIDVYKNVAKK